MQENAEDVLDYVRLMLEAKLLQWRRENMPEIPLLLRQTDSKIGSSDKGTDSRHSPLLDLWRLWQQELDLLSMEHPAVELLQLSSEAENLEWDPLGDDSLPPLTQGDDQLNLALMSEVSERLKDVRKAFTSTITDQEVNPEAVERLDREAYALSCMSN